MSNSPAIVSRTAWLRASSRKGMAQPPRVNPFLGSSSGPPGDCMTPSSVTWVIAMLFLIISLQFFAFRILGRTTGASFDTTQRILDTGGAHCESSQHGRKYLFAL